MSVYIKNMSFTRFIYFVCHRPIINKTLETSGITITKMKPTSAEIGNEFNTKPVVKLWTVITSDDVY